MHNINSLHRLVALISSSHLSTKSKGLFHRPPDSGSLSPKSSKNIQKEKRNKRGREIFSLNLHSAFPLRLHNLIKPIEKNQKVQSINDLEGKTQAQFNCHGPNYAKTQYRLCKLN